MAVLCLALAAPGPLVAQSPTAPPIMDASHPLALPVIGLLVPLKGELGPVGKQLVTAATLAVQDAGVELVVVDSGASPDVAAARVMELAAHPRLVGIIGPLGKRTSRAAATAAARAGVPLLMLTSAPGGESISSWVWRLRPSPGELGAMMGVEARRNLKLESAAVLFPSTDYGDEAARAFIQSFTQGGGRVSAAVRYDPALKDLRKPLDELVGKRMHVKRGVRVDGRGADRDGYVTLKRKHTRTRGVDFEGLFIPDFHTRISRFLPLMSSSGIQTGECGKGKAVQLLGMPGWQGDTLRLTGAHAAGALYHDPFGGENAGGRAEEFSLLFESTTGNRPVDLDAEVFDAVTLLARTSVRSWRKRRVRQLAVVRTEVVQGLMVLQKSPWRGVCGDWSFGSHGQPTRLLDLYRFDVDGEVMLVE